MTDPALLDELALNATASTTLQYVDGWALRASPALPFRRSNCAIALRGGGSPPWEEMDHFYETRGLPVRAQISDGRGAAVDESFAARGFTIDAPVDVLVAPTQTARDGNAAAPDVVVTVSDALDDSFAEIYGRMHDDERVRAYGRLMRTIGPAACVVVAHLDGAPAGMVFGVLERGWCGVYGLTTVPHARGRGVASTVMHALAGAALAAGAADTYLQVERDNTAALALYQKTGFIRAYGYHYRVRPVAPAVRRG
jgi:ribosomal protein S18 acetylase RimI-like enzyme